MAHPLLAATPTANPRLDASPASAVGEYTPIVRTAHGSVRGNIANGIHSFLGIRFAKAPFGDNRFRAPQPVADWEGVRDAVAFGPKAPQAPYPPAIQQTLPELTATGEDCLTLNIWSRDLGSARQPVMVWIPGGMFEVHGTGACPWYDGSRFARDGVVCVTIGYRVGADGFLYLGDGLANLGLLDQIAALEWVQDNIAAFGGDPGNVTVFGESAGALSIGDLLAMPRARGLFRRAIVQSGGAHHVTSAETAERIGRRLADRLKVAATRAAIAAVPLERLIEAQGELKAELTAMSDPGFWGEVALTNLPWQPVVDGVIIPDRPIDLIRAGASADVDLLLGSNIDETRLFLAIGGSIAAIPSQALAGLVSAYGLAVEPALAAYRAIYPYASDGDLFSAIQTDWYWRMPALRLAEAHAVSRSSGTFMYEFAWRGSPAFDGRVGAGHSMEIPYVFDTLGNETEPLHGPSPPQPLADVMHSAWISFATTGNPGWSQFDLDRRATMRFDLVSKLVDDPLSHERKIWEGVR